MVRLILTVFLAIISNCLFAINDLRFHHITLEDGLSSSHVYCMAQDQLGYLWIGTKDGLNRYDGYSFVTYYSDPYDSLSIKDNTVFSILTDSDTAIWVGTFSGLSLFNPAKGIFHTIKFGSLGELTNLFSVNHIIKDKFNNLWIATEGKGVIKYNPSNGEYRIYNKLLTQKRNPDINIMNLWMDISGLLWLGTEGEGLYYLDTLSGQFTMIADRNNDQAIQGDEEVLKLFHDTDNNLWIGTRNKGIYRYGLMSGEFTHFLHEPSDVNSIGGNEVYAVNQDKFGNIWIGVNDGGLNLFNKESNSFYRYVHNENDKQSILNNKVRYIYEDNHQNLWVVSYQKGLNIFHPYYTLFRYYSVEGTQQYKFESNSVLSMVMDNNKNIWAGTDGGGLKYIDRQQNKTISYLPNETQVPNDGLPDKVVMTIHIDDNQDLWLGTYVGGMARFETETDQWQWFQNIPCDSSSLSDNFVSDILEDPRGNIWVATNGGGVNLLNKETGKFKRYINTPNRKGPQIVSNYTSCLMMDRNDRLWVGTYYGFSIIDIKTGTIKSHKKLSNQKDRLSHNTIYCFLEDRNGRYWVGTQNGLNLFDEEHNFFQVFTQEHGLPNNTINSIQEDNEGKLWISTNRGISNFDYDKNEFKNYLIGDGLQSNEFLRGASYKGFNGELFFGGINGFNSFFPIEFDITEEFPKVVITGLKIFNEDVPVNGLINNFKVLPKSISYLDHINLLYNFKSFSLEFSAMNYTLPQKVQYEYKMEGFDNDWKQVNASYRYVTYTNLDPGEYRFLIKASSIDNNWGEEYSSLKVTIRPPIWQTWQAKLFYIVFAFFVAFAIYFRIRGGIARKNKINREKMVREKNDAINQAKLRFFTNLSHEFRTPLTLILGPLEQILNNRVLDKNMFPRLELVHTNARRMLRLVNQLLDMRKVDNEKMKLKAEKADLVSFVKNIIFSFEEYAKHKKVSLLYTCNIHQLVLWFDQDKVDKILFNLLSNAFKFTQPKGSVSVVLKKEKHPEQEDREFAVIEVKDTGRGIDGKHLDKIFDRFYQVPGSTDVKGSGLGLTLTKSFVELHHGFIEVQSKSDIGTAFKIWLPVDEDVFSDEEKVSSEQNVKKHMPNYIPIIEPELSQKNRHREAKSLGSVMVVEDNFDLNNYLVKELSAFYTVYSASNGKEAREQVLEKIPDLIISDIMMPEEDGLSLCNFVKSNILTSHVPVILLTARVGNHQQIEGFESGADAYISKPFSIDFLFAQVKQLLENRRRIKEKYKETLVSHHHNEPEVEINDKFIENVNEYIQKNIQDVTLNVEKMSRDLGISRGHLHRKMKNVLDIGPNEYIRVMRLKEGARLLANKEFNISEISYMIGFNNPAYFTKCFKDHFQISPSDYMSK